MKPTRFSLRLAALVALVLLSSLSPILAGTHTWTGASGDGKWSTAFNWANNSEPVAGETGPVIVQFPAADMKHSTNDLANLTLDQIQITSDNYVIAATGVGANVTLRSQTGFSSTFFITGANAMLTNFNFTLATNFSPYASISVGPSDTATFRCRFSGPGGLVKRAGGTAVLDGNAANTYAGKTEIQAGTLRLSQNGVAVPGELVIGYPALTNLASVELHAYNQVGDNADIMVNHNGSFVPGLNSDIVGSITLSNANLVAGIGLTLQGDFTSIGTNLVTGTIRLGGATRTFHVTGRLTADVFIENPMGTAGIIKTGPGIMELRRPNTYNGITDVRSGTMIVSHSSGLGTSAGDTRVDPDATLQLKGSVSIVAETLFISGSGLSGNGVLYSTGGSASWSGAVFLTDDTFIGVDQAADQLTLSGPIGGAGSLTKVGDGKLILSGPNPNTFSGVTRVWDGTLRLAKSANLRAVRELEIGTTNTAATCELGGSNQIDDAARVTVWHRGEFKFRGFDETVAGLTLVGSIVDTEGGLLTLLGDVESVSWYGWDSNQSEETTFYPKIHGRLSLGGATRTIHLTTESPEAGSVLELGCDISDGAGTGGLRKTGYGWLLLNGSNTYSGPTFIEEGTVLISRSSALGNSMQGTVVSDGAMLALGFSGLSVAEPLTLNGHGILGLAASLENMEGTNTWTGPITLASDSAIGGYYADTLLTVTGTIGGTGRLTKLGEGALDLAGSSPNVFTGGLTVSLGTVLLRKPSGVTSVRNQLRVGTANAPAGSARLVWRGAHQVQDGVPVFVDASGALDLGVYYEEVGPLTMRGGVISGISGVLILGGDIRAEKPPNGDCLINCNLSLGAVTRTFETIDVMLKLTRDIQDGGAAAGIRKTGSGSLVLDNAKTSYSGLTEARQGRVELRGDASFGNTTAGTIIYSGSLLGLTDATVGFESLTFEYEPPTWTNPSLFARGTNWWQGPLTLRQHLVTSIEDSMDRLSLFGKIDGDTNVALALVGRGVLRIAGTNSNTFPGRTVALGGRIELAKTNGLAVAGELVVDDADYPSGFGSAVRLINHHQISDTKRVTVNSHGVFDLNGFTEMVGGLDLNGGQVETGAGQLRLNGDVEVTKTSTINGRLSLGDDSRTFQVDENGQLKLYAAVSALDSGAGLTQTGSGTIHYGGTNTFGGQLQILGGHMYAETPFAFGTSAAGTVASNFARITLGGDFGVTNEPLHLADGQLLGRYECTNAWYGPITVGQRSVIHSVGTNGRFLLGGAISGNGDLTLNGNFILHGSQPNTFSGELWAHEGLIQLSKTNAVAVPAGLVVGNRFDYEVATVQLLQPNQIADNSAVGVYSKAGSPSAPFLLDLNGFADTIGSLNGDGNVVLGSGKLTVGGDNTSTEFKGTISGGGATALVKIGSGALTLSGVNNYQGITRVSGGTLLVNGSIVPSPVHIDANGNLGGHGVTGDVVSNGGRVIPGPTTANPSYGRLKSGTVSFNSGSTYRCELLGPLAGTEADQVEVNGFLNIANSTLNVQAVGPGAVGNQYTIIRVATGAAAFGSFAGLPEGSIFTPMPGRTYSITYHGGPAGRDVVLTQLAAPQPPQISGIKPFGVGEIQLSGSGTPGFAYEVYAATNIVSTNWVKLGGMTADGNGVLEFVDGDIANFPMRFYRIVLP